MIKERTPEEKQKEHREGIIKTIVASVLGILAGVLAFSLYGTGEDRIWYAVLMIVIALTYFIQKLIYPQLKIDAKEFKAKDWFYVEFIVIDFFLVTWTLLSELKSSFLNCKKAFLKLKAFLHSLFYYRLLPVRFTKLL